MVVTFKSYLKGTFYNDPKNQNGVNSSLEITRAYIIEVKSALTFLTNLVPFGKKSNLVCLSVSQAVQGVQVLDFGSMKVASNSSKTHQKATKGSSWGQHVPEHIFLRSGVRSWFRLVWSDLVKYCSILSNVYYLVHDRSGVMFSTDREK